MTMRLHARWPLLALIGLLITACDANRWRPAPELPANWTSNNACEDLRPLLNVHPRYPEVAASEQQQGWVALKYHVAASGAVFNVRVVAASPREVFEDVSVSALSRWRYQPQKYPVQNCTHVYVYAIEPGKGPPVPSQDEASFAEFEEIQAR